MPVARTPRLAIDYVERNHDADDTVVLVHGFPDDALTWEPLLACEPFARARTIVPSLRGFGATRFLHAGAPREAPASALARDVVDLLDALDIDRCTLVGHDWGARAAYGAAVLAPERFDAVVALSVGYGTNVPGHAMAYDQVQAYWYQWFFATERGAAALRDDAAALCRHLWQVWSPGWAFEEAAYARTARAFENPDFAAVVAHSYRHRWGFAAATLEARGAADDERLAPVPPIAVPTLVVHGDCDGATLLEATAHREASFTAAYERVVVPGSGHFVQRENPRAVAMAVSMFRERLRSASRTSYVGDADERRTTTPLRPEQNQSSSRLLNQEPPQIANDTFGLR